MGLLDKLLKSHDFITSEWLTNSFLKISTKLGGKKVSEVEAALRINACNACEYIGQVKKEVDFTEFGLPKIGKKKIEFKGCTKCGCPMAVKPFFETHLFQLVNSDKSNSFINGTVTCPHPNGDKWAKIKEQLNSQKEYE